MSTELPRMLVQVERGIAETEALLSRLRDLEDRIRSEMLRPIPVLDAALLDHARPAFVVETADEPTPEDKRELDEFYAQAALRIVEGEPE